MRSSQPLNQGDVDVAHLAVRATCLLDEYPATVDAVGYLPNEALQALTLGRP